VSIDINIIKIEQIARKNTLSARIDKTKPRKIKRSSHKNAFFTITHSDYQPTRDTYTSKTFNPITYISLYLNLISHLSISSAPVQETH